METHSVIRAVGWFAEKLGAIAQFARLTSSVAACSMRIADQAGSIGLTILDEDSNLGKVERGAKIALSATLISMDAARVVGHLCETKERTWPSERKEATKEEGEPWPIYIGLPVILVHVGAPILRIWTVEGDDESDIGFFQGVSEWVEVGQTLARLNSETSLFDPGIALSSAITALNAKQVELLIQDNRFGRFLHVYRERRERRRREEIVEIAGSPAEAIASLTAVSHQLAQLLGRLDRGEALSQHKRETLQVLVGLARR